MFVVEMTEYTAAHKRALLRKQSSSPSQSRHIVGNPKKEEPGNPWNELDCGVVLHTPKWSYQNS